MKTRFNIIMLLCSICLILLTNCNRTKYPYTLGGYTIFDTSYNSGLGLEYEKFVNECTEYVSNEMVSMHSTHNYGKTKYSLTEKEEQRLYPFIFAYDLSKNNIDSFPENYGENFYVKNLNKFNKCINDSSVYADLTEIEKVNLEKCIESVKPYYEKYLEKQLEYIEDAKSRIEFTHLKCSRPNSAGGVDLYLYYINKHDNPIKYIYTTVSFYNAVGDIISSEIGHNYSFRLQDTGPINQNAKGGGVWGNVIYNYSTRSAKISKVEITYMDGSKYEISDPKIIEAVSRCK